MSNIDFVIPWVDGNDPNWQEDKNRFLKENGDKSDIRFRDWGLLKYWFRGVEEYTPWVNRIHFITWGHIPAWLNTNHEKLSIVFHKDYIPHKYLPTFNSNTIELNIHRIKGLSNRFVYFNDDIFIINKISKKNFFSRGKPCSMAGLGIIGLQEDLYNRILLNNIKLLNRIFNAKEVSRNQAFKFINYKYGLKNVIKNLVLLFWCQDFFPGFHVEHGPNSYLKKNLEELWQVAGNELDEVCTHKFRTATDINQYIFLWSQWCKGDFHPYNLKKLYTWMNMGHSIVDIQEAILKRKPPILVLNDNVLPENKIDMIRNAITDSFEQILPNKSSFEL